MKPALNGVTVCAADCVAPALAARALRLSVAACEFGDAVLFTDAAIEDPAFRTVRIERLGSLDDYSRFVLKSLAAHVATPHVLLIQWDGYVADPLAWTPEFLDCDYIGAPWPWYDDGMTVGNGGFSLRSRRLLQATASERFALAPGMPEDHQVCRLHRKALSDGHGMRFAPEALANRFSYERAPPTRSTFGFHGPFNLWRHVEDREMAAIAPLFPESVARSGGMVELLVQYVALRKFAAFDAVYRRLRAARPRADIQADARGFTRDPRMLVLFDATCERAE